MTAVISNFMVFLSSLVCVVNKIGSPERWTTFCPREKSFRDFRWPASGCACAPVSLLRTVVGFLPPFQWIGYEPNADSNRDLNQPKAEPSRQTAGMAANWLKV
jgi:hypothetical protein